MNEGHARKAELSVARSASPVKLLLPWAKFIFAMVCPWSLSSWTNTSCLPSGENAGVPPLVIALSQPAAGMLAPVEVE